MNDSNTNTTGDAAGTTTRCPGRRLRRGLVIVAATGAVAVGSLAVADRGGDRGARMVEHVSDRLELDGAQSESLDVLLDTVTGLRGTLRADGVGDELRALVAGPTLDQARALAMIESRADAVRAAAPGLVADAAAFYDGLDERQRAEVDGMLERIGDGRRGRGWRH